MRLLVAHDGRDGGRDALHLARVLAASEAEASALVITSLYGAPWPLAYTLLSGEDEEPAESRFAEARDVLAALAVECRAYGGGSPAAILTSLAEQESFDMIVIGSPHRGPLGRVLIGSVATSLLNGAPIDVAVAPQGYADRNPDTLRDIAVGYDGGAEARVALQRAEGLAKHFRARLRLLTVVTPPVAAPAMPPVAYSQTYPLDPERVIDEGLHSVDEALTVEPVRLDGDPAIELSRECAEGVDLLVVGSRGYGPLARVLLGSVSRRVVQEARCPVLVVRRS